MEHLTQLNRIELIGIIGSIQVSEISGKKVARINVATNLAYRTSDGAVCIETTWTPVTAFEGKSVNLDGLEKAQHIHVIGRLRNLHYAAANGTERNSIEVLASTVEKICQEKESLQCETSQ